MAIHVRGLTHVYHRGSPREIPALRGVDLHVPRGAYVAIVGPVGSGKSTFLQHLNGLLRPQEGEVHVLGTDVGRAAAEELRALRRRVGLVFQYPEHQLFAETVGDDIAFGPRNMGIEGAELERRVLDALAAVDLPADIRHRSPFSLSGGQRRRVAIAGVLAMEPEVLIMDEPAAGLDPRGRRHIFQVVDRFHRRGKTVVIATHDMALAAQRADYVAAFFQGRVVMQGAPGEVFRRPRELEDIGLDVPQVTRVLLRLRSRGWPGRAHGLTVEEAVEELTSWEETGPA